jgi:hypothetical protein
MKTQAIQKIQDELGKYKGNRYGDIMKYYVANVLQDFCQQNEEFAQAVVQGGSFADCMKAVADKIRQNSISDLDACKAAAEFYFPGCVVDFHMEIRMSKFGEAQETDGILLRLEDFL